jgi:predicted Holliday junction resolvase-like endonuclease
VKNELISSFHDFQKILVICPACKQIHRLSELKLSYRGRAKRTWLDKLRDETEKVERAEEHFEEQRDEIKMKAQEKGRRQLPGLLKKCVPVICAHGYYPQDLKAIFDPIDFVIFDGMNLKERVKRIVLFDGPAHDNKREKVQNSIKKVINKGNYEWHTVKLDDTGRIAERWH